MGNPITWFELLGSNPEQTAKFYGELFGWHTETTEGGYILIDTHSGKGMNGGIGEPPEGGQAGPVFYAQGPDIQALLDQAIALGSTVAQPVTEIPEMVTYATFIDPWGNRVGLMKGDGDGAPVSSGDNPTVDWVEISCKEPEEAWKFYGKLFGWRVDADPSQGDGPIHGGIDTGSEFGARGGIGSSRDGNPSVEVYAKVDDLAKYLERAEGLDGKIVMPAMKVDEHTEIAMFVDPQGLTFGMYSESH
jgi:predicted enzyme related to lactoylglutathione lyase